MYWKIKWGDSAAHVLPAGVKWAQLSLVGCLELLSTV